MSEYTVIAMEFNDGPSLKDALDEMGAKYEIDLKYPIRFGHSWHEKPQPEANIVVVGLQKEKSKIESLGKYRQFGFIKQKDGTFGVVADNGYVPKDFLQQLKQTYAKHKVIKQARKLGFTLASQKKIGW